MNLRSVTRLGLGVLVLMTLSTGCWQSATQSVSNSASTQNRSTDPGETTSEPDYNVGSGWLTFRGNENSTGVATGILPEKLQEVWQLEIKNSAFESTPIIVPGKTADEPGRVYIGDADKYFYAINLKTGVVDWQFETEFGFVASAAYHDGRIYVGDVDGKFYCLSDTGDKLWEFAADAQIDSAANFYGDLVLFGSRDAKLYALNRITGEKAWDLETSDEVRCGITIIEGHAFVAGCDAAFHIINVQTGEEVGNVEINSPSGVTPAAEGEIVFTGTENAGVFAINWKEPGIVWNFDDDDGAISTRSSAALSGKHVVFGTSHRTVYSLNPENGERNWATELKSSIETSPIIVGEHVYIGSGDGRLYRLNLADGKIVWNKQLNGGLIGSPAVAFGKLVIATDRGVVYCLGK